VEEILQPNKMLICDDHDLFCLGLKELLSAHLNKTEIFTVNTKKECEELLEQHFFDVFICDIKIGSDNGLQLIKSNQTALAETTVIVLSGHYEDYLLRKAKNIGVDYFLKKEASLNELLPAISNNPSMRLEKIFKEEDVDSPVSTLSKKETEIIKLIAAGYQSKEIATKLFISKVTVDTHRRNIHRKMNTTSTGELLKLVYEGIIEL
jgi:DNA-binding NarL/FixJ family response regulator